MMPHSRTGQTWLASLQVGAELAGSVRACSLVDIRSCGTSSPWHSAWCSKLGMTTEQDDSVCRLPLVV